MRKKIITMAVTLLLLGLLSAVEQMAVKRLTDDAMARTQEILSLLAQNQTARGLERAREMDAWWDEEAPRVETLINHEATDDVRFTLSRLVAALEMGDRDGAVVYARHRACFGAADAVVAESAVNGRVYKKLHLRI